MLRRYGIWMVLALAVVAVVALAVGPAGADGMPVDLEGRTIFAGYFSTSGDVFSPADLNNCPATGMLIHTGGQNYDLELLECGFRTSTWKLRITPGGTVHGEAWAVIDPAQWEPGGVLSTVTEHTGCPVNGEFPMVHGRWDGTNLTAYTSFHGRCDGGTFWGDPDWWLAFAGIVTDGVSWDDGPAHVTFGVEVSVAD